MTSTCLLLIGASVLLWVGLFQRDYSIAYVAKNSSNDLPTLFTFTAFWSSLEGSHTLWMLLLSIMGTVAVWTHSKDNEHIMPYVLGSIQAVLGWMLYLAVT